MLVNWPNDLKKWTWRLLGMSPHWLRRPSKTWSWPGGGGGGDNFFRVNWLKISGHIYPVFFFSPWKKIVLPWKNQRKCPWNCPWKKMKIKSVRETKKVSVKDAKISKKCPWNKKSVREKSEKNVRESNFLPWKKPKKRPKMAFTHTFGFHGKKKHWIKEWSLEVI